MPITHTELQVVKPEVLYTLDAFQQITGVKRVGIRAMKAKGLQVRYIGNKAFILGKDFIEYTAKKKNQRER